MHGETSDAAKRRAEREAELAAGSGDETRPLADDGKPGCPVIVWDGPCSTRCAAGAAVGRCAHHGTFATPAPPPAPDLDETCVDCGHALHYAIRCGEVDDAGCECISFTTPAQPPAPDPDETCPDCHGAGYQRLGCSLDNHRPTPAPPATTGPADEAEGLAWLLNAVDWPDGMGDDDYSRRQADAVLASDWLAARDAAQQRIGAEKAWYEAHAPHCPMRTFEPCHEQNPYRADRIAREGQA